MMTEMDVVLGVTDSEASLNAFSWIKHNPLHLWSNLRLTLVHVLKKSYTGSGVELLRRYEYLAKEFAQTVSTRLLSCNKNVGHTLKEFVAGFEVRPILVLGCTKTKWGVIDYCVQRCECPVMIVKRDYTSYAPVRPVVGLAMDANVHGDRAFNWFLKHAELPDNSQLYVVHITPKKTEKPDARRFLAALKPKCMESKRMYSMASALVSYDQGTVPYGIMKFCYDKDVATLLIAGKGERHSPFRISKSITEECLRNSSLDIMVWQDEQTRTVSSSPFIKTFEGVEPPLIRLDTWEKESIRKDSIRKDSIENRKNRTSSNAMITKETKKKKKFTCTSTRFSPTCQRCNYNNNNNKWASGRQTISSNC